MLRLRLLHILCIEKFHGKKYKTDFINQIKELLYEMTNTKVDRIQVVIGCDNLCADCLEQRGITLKRDKDHCNNTIIKKERELLQLLNIQENFIYETELLFNLIRQNHSNGELYDNINCDTCEWNDKCALYQAIID